MLYKLDNDTLRAAPRTLRHADGSVTCNPTDAQLLAAGYLPLADDSPPEYDEVTQYVETAFVRGEGQIYTVWTVKDRPPEEESVEEVP